MSHHDLIERHLAWCEASGMAGPTIRDRRKLLVRLERDCGPLLSVTTDGLVAWLVPFSGWTLCTYYGHAAAFFRWAILVELLHVDPTQRMRPPRRPRGVPRPAPAEVVRAVLADGTDPYVTIVLLATYAGLRIGDIVRLRREDVTEHTIRVRQGKGGKDAELPTHADIWAHLKRRPAGLVLPGPAGMPLDPSHLATRFTRYLNRIGQPHVTAHQFRHLYGTLLYRSTRDLLLTQQLMRHSSVATTQIYAQLVDETKTAAIRGLQL